MKKRFLLLALVALFSCRQTKIDTETYTAVQTQGDKITKLAQAELLKNVGQAMKSGGTEYAITFCNLRASSIVDSLSNAHGAVISRISEKNRNPGNNLASKHDKKLWQIFEDGGLKDTVVAANNNFFYYKTIKTAMPTCLKCHGKIGGDIAPSVHEKLQTLYPNDLATGYNLNEFRGLWKVEFK